MSEPPRASGQLHRAVVDRAGVAQVDLGVGPRRDVGEDEPPSLRLPRVLAGLAAVEVQVGDVLLAVGEGCLAEEQVGVPRRVRQRVADAGVAGVGQGPAAVLDADAERLDGMGGRVSVRTVKGPISKVPDFSVWKSKTSLIECSEGVSAYAVVSRCSVPSGP